MSVLVLIRDRQLKFSQMDVFQYNKELKKTVYFFLRGLSCNKRVYFCRFCRWTEALLRESDAHLAVFLIIQTSHAKPIIWFCQQYEYESVSFR